MSPFTVAMMTWPLVFLGLSAMASLTTAKAAFAASALMRSWGRNTVPFSKPLPTRSSEGMSSASIISSDSLPESSCSFIASAALPVTPLSIASASVRTALEDAEDAFAPDEAATPEPGT